MCNAIWIYNFRNFGAQETERERDMEKNPIHLNWLDGNHLRKLPWIIDTLTSMAKYVQNIINTWRINLLVALTSNKTAPALHSSYKLYMQYAMLTTTINSGFVLWSQITKCVGACMHMWNVCVCLYSVHVGRYGIIDKAIMQPCMYVHWKCVRVITMRIIIIIIVIIIMKLLVEAAREIIIIIITINITIESFGWYVGCTIYTPYESIDNAC